MTVNFYTFSKNTDSTKQPAGDGTPKTVRLKDATSIINPVLLLDRFTYSNDWNYLYIPEFKRYYFINDTVYDGAVAEVHCAVDTLASWKTEIGSTSQYVVRSASANDGTIIDKLYPLKTGCSEVVARDGALPSIDQGVFVFGVTSVEAVAGTVCYYACEYTTFSYICARLMDYIVNQTGWNQDWIPWAFQNALIDPLSKIVSCKWFPQSYAGLSGTSQNYIMAGDWSITDANISVKKLARSTLEEGGVVTKHFLISDHPQAAARGSYMNTLPFTQTEIAWNPFGIIPIDPNLYKDDPYLLVNLHFDYSTGLGYLDISTTTTSVSIVPTKQRIGFAHGMVGVDVRLSQAVTNLIQGVGNIVTGGIGNAMSGNFLGVTDAIDSVDNFVHPQIMSNGQNGNFSAYALHSTPMLIQRFFSAVPDDNTHKGRPLMDVRTISTLSGFMQCDHVDLDLPATATEIDRIKSLMEKGFYYE